MKQLVLFFSIAYLISWTIWLPLYSDVFFLEIKNHSPYRHALGGLGPMLSALFCAFVFEGRKGVMSLKRKCCQVKPFIYLLIALLAPFLLAIISSLVNTITNGSAFSLAGIGVSKEFDFFNPATFLIYNLAFFGFGEEAGWRGFALPRLQSRYNAIISTFILTLFWAVWHWPLFFFRPGYASMGSFEIAGWFFSLLTGSVLLTWLFNSSGGSILICAVLHATIDVVFTADYADKSIVNILGVLITLWGIFILLYFKPQNLSRKQRVQIKLY